MAATSGIATSKVSPKYLESNATSHIWPFSAIAELIDNAYDPDVDAKELCIDQLNIRDVPCLLFKDNGRGMDHEHLLKMLSFGFCEKDQYVQRGTHLPIGHYGNGFKSGSMRLAKDALVFTVCKESASIGVLSRSYLEAIKADTVLIPVLQYSVPELERIDDGQVGSNLEAILTHSPFQTEEELLNELRDISKAVANKRFLRSGIHTGTKIYLFNLKKLHNGRHELDFQTDLKDIQIPEVFETDATSEGSTKSADSSRPTTTSDKPQHLVSLRKYCSILFLKPRMNIIIRGQRVRREIISRSLCRTEVLSYKPTWSKDAFNITFGFTQKEEYNKGNYGIMLYNRNRLIKAYQKMGYQKKPDGKGLGVVGVVEVDCLTPIHNKQDFMRDEKFNSLIVAFGTKLNAFWDEQPEDVLKSLPKPDFQWVCCEECAKWRKLPAGAPFPAEDEVWTCSMNPESQYNECDIEEEHETETPARRRYNKKTCNKQPNTAKRKARESKGKETKRARGETIESFRRSLGATFGTELNIYSDKQIGGTLELLLQEAKTYVWTRCDDCGKWRKLPVDVSCPEDYWTCSMNPDSQYNRCDIEEDLETETLTKRRHSKKICNEKPLEDIKLPANENAWDIPLTSPLMRKSTRNAGKRKAEDKEKETERNRRETIESYKRSEDPENERTFSTESEVHEEKGKGQTEKDQQTRASEQKDADENTKETHLWGFRNSESAYISPAEAPLIRNMQQSRPRDINADNVALQSMNLQAIKQEPLYDAGSYGYSFCGTQMETSFPAGQDTLIASREAAYQHEKLVANSSVLPIKLEKSNFDSKTVPPRPVKTQVNPVPQTQTSSSNQKNSSRSAPANTMKTEATQLPAQQQDTVPKRRFDAFRRNVHDMLCKLKPDEHHGSVAEIEITVKKVLAKYEPNYKN